MVDRTAILTGTLPFILLASALLTAPVSFFLLWLYRRAVIGSMNRMGSGAKPAPPLPSAGGGSAFQPLRVSALDAASAVALTRYTAIDRSLRELALVYITAGLAYALVFTTIWMTVVTPGGFILSRFAWLTVVFAWPIALTLILVTATSMRERFAIIVAYLVVLLAIGSYAISRNSDILDWKQLVSFWLLEQGPTTVLLLAYLARRVRAPSEKTRSSRSCGVLPFVRCMPSHLNPACVTTL